MTYECGPAKTWALRGCRSIREHGTARPRRSESIATKQDLKELELLIQRDIKELELRLQREMAEIKNDIIKWVAGMLVGPGGGGGNAGEAVVEEGIARSGLPVDHAPLRGIMV